MTEKEKYQDEQVPVKDRICRGPGKGTPCPACRNKSMESGTNMLQRPERELNEEMEN